ncbi:MAG TPA: tRNA (adenosine(37)-N6)-threonylcarbamoyltransferase complex ATPase subunit type 1 TsaE, partial [Dongiaceae bacterium]|nr:tRNA (adenosine(37)-N6)-threonylcarbamoyltransferase complex ATPase subunit type 1 TsaE [Dongiaceae bacterium]
MASLGDEGATVRLARQVAAVAHAGDVIALSGGLGVGKTRFARAFIDAPQGDRDEVPSPTFTLVQTYDTPAGTIWHF